MNQHQDNEEINRRYFIYQKAGETGNWNTEIHEYINQKSGQQYIEIEKENVENKGKLQKRTPNHKINTTTPARKNKD